MSIAAPLVSWVGRPPIGIEKMLVVPPPSTEKAMVRPSGEKRGENVMEPNLPSGDRRPDARSST